MPNTLAFVDKIDASPTTRLALINSPTWNLKSFDFSPPPLKRVRVATLLRDGDAIPASAYSNRIIELDLLVQTANADAMGTQLQTLHRELDRPNNILKWQQQGATNPVFFRTFRSPDYKLDKLQGSDPTAIHVYRVKLRLEAEPFAYGLRVTGSPVTVNNDPAAVSNPCYFDVTGVTGDVPTPALIELNPSPINAVTFNTLIAIRRHGTPGGVYILQAESLGQGTDTTVQANDPVMSGAGSNYSRTWDNVGDTNTMVTRLQLSNAFPAAASVEIRGRYKIFARLRRSDATSVINIQIQAGSVSASPVAVPLSTNRQWLELGDVSVPAGVKDPITDGYANSALIPEPSTLTIKAERVSGTGTLDWDVFLVVPIDENFVLVSHTNSSALNAVIDGPNEALFQKTIADGWIITPTTPTQASGSLAIDLAPNQTNRVVLLLSSALIAAVNDDISWTSSVTVSYWPRWLYIRP